MPKMPKAKPKANGREVIYPDVECRLCIDEKAITADIAKKLLGWQEQPKECTDYHLIDMRGNKVKCHNNVTNRPLYLTVVASLQQEHLRKRWLMNGEPIIIGRTGYILNGQHTLISLILAVQEWESDKEKWEEWESEPTMSKVVVFGIDESDSVVNTMDTCKPRTLADAIYRSEFFADMPKDKDRKAVARVLDYAVKMLWHRTGADANAFAPRRTHSEALAFIAKHPKILECVKHIYEEDSDQKQIGRYISTGYAAGLLYLMGSCKTDNIEEYRASPNESLLNWDMWDEACDFWVKLAGKDKSLIAVHNTLNQMIEEMHGTRPERTALIAKAWSLVVAGKPVTLKSVALDYTKDDDGFSVLNENPIIGGIDSIEPIETDVDPSPEEVEERAEEIRQERDAKKAAGPKSKGKKSKPKSIPDGTQVWIAEDGGHWTGVVQETYDGPNGVVAKVKMKTGKVFEVSADDCITEEPEDL